MDIKGKEKFDGFSVEEVWDLLLDPEVLKSVIPGCEELNYFGDGKYEVVMHLGVAAVKGKYTGEITIDEVDKPNHYILKAEGSGGPGHVKAEMNCKIVESDKGSVLEWDTNAKVGGLIASVGSRVLAGIAKYMAKKFFSDIKKQATKK